MRYAVKFPMVEGYKWCGERTVGIAHPPVPENKRKLFTTRQQADEAASHWGSAIVVEVPE